MVVRMRTLSHVASGAGRRLRRLLGQPGRPPHEDAGSVWSPIAFEEHERFRPFELLPDAGVFHDEDDVDTRERRYVGHALQAPYLTVELTPNASPASSAAGLACPSGTVEAEYDPGTGIARITFDAGPGPVQLAATAVKGPCMRLAVTFTENVVVLWRGGPAGWEVLLKHALDRDKSLDLRTTGEITGSRLYCRGGFRKVRAGYFGYLGLRDPQLIRRPDGEPVHRGGRVWITATCAGPGFFPAAHWAVFSFPAEDPSDLRLESHLFFERDGLRLGDHAGFILHDGGSALLGVSSWGDFAENAHIRRASSQRDLLTGVHVLESQRWELPTEYDSWDPSMLLHDGKWWLGFVECTGYKPRFTFRPALAATQVGAGWDAPLAYIGADEVHQQTEGTMLTLHAGTLNLLASDGDARDYPVYDLEMNRIDTLHAPYPTNIPHPLVIDVGGNPFILTFDGTPVSGKELGYGTHGDVIILRPAAE